MTDRIKTMTASDLTEDSVLQPLSIAADVVDFDDLSDEELEARISKDGGSGRGGTGC